MPIPLSFLSSLSSYFCPLTNILQWSRLIGGSRSLSNKSFKATTPTERLTAFKRTCNTLQVSALDI